MQTHAAVSGKVLSIHMQLTITAIGEFGQEAMGYRSDLNTSATTSHLNTVYDNIHTHIHTWFTYTAWSRKCHLSCWSHMAKKKHPHSHVPLNEPNYSGTNKESWHTVSQAFTHRVYICSESIWTPRQHPNLPFISVTNIKHHTQKKVGALKSVPGSRNLPHIYIWQVTKKCSALSWTLELKNKV